MVRDFLRFRLRFVVLLLRMWLRKAENRLIFPVPVFLKRLAAPRFVFIFGMSGLFRCKGGEPPGSCAFG